MPGEAAGETGQGPPTSVTAFSRTPRSPPSIHEASIQQGERRVRHDPCPGQEDRSARQLERAPEKGDELLEGPPDSCRGGRLVDDHHAFPEDGEAEGERRRGARGRNERRAQRAGAVVHLGLRQVERILAFDRPARDIVAERVAGDREIRGDHQRELGLGHVPIRVPSDADPFRRPANAPAGRLEEELGPDGIVDMVVHGRLGRLLHPRIARAFVGDAGGPYLLIVDGGEQPGGRGDWTFTRAVEDHLGQAARAPLQDCRHRQVGGQKLRGTAADHPSGKTDRPVRERQAEQSGAQRSLRACGRRRPRDGRAAGARADGPAA